MKTLKLKVTGIRPLVMHNGLLADPTNPYVIAIKRITSKGSKKMTEADHRERDRLEWMGGLYWSDALGVVVPSDNVERCVQEGAKKSRLGKDCQAAVFVTEPEIQIMHDAINGKTREEMLADEAQRFTLRKGVKVQLSRIIRIRPMIPTKWTAAFQLEYDDSIINKANLYQAIVDAGALVGLGDWRPKFGRFTVEELS